MEAKDVRPQKWLWDEDYEPIVLYDDGEYSAVWGKYENSKCLGVRYNISANGSTVGYPSQGANPLWYIEPHFLVLPLLDEFLRLAKEEGETEYEKNIEFAKKEFLRKQNQ